MEEFFSSFDIYFIVERSPLRSKSLTSSLNFTLDNATYNPSQVILLKWLGCSDRDKITLLIVRPWMARRDHEENYFLNISACDARIHVEDIYSYLPVPCESLH